MNVGVRLGSAVTMCSSFSSVGSARYSLSLSVPPVYGLSARSPGGEPLYEWIDVREVMSEARSDD